MKRKKRLLWLSVAIVVLALGRYFLQASWDREHRIRAVLPPEEQQVLAQSQSFILYSLDPRSQEMEPRKRETRPTFHDYVILGQTQVTDANQRTELLDALYSGMGKGELVACYEPRHGIHAVRSNKAVDLVICFECMQVEIYDEHGEHAIDIDPSPKSVFDRILTEAHVPLPGQ